MPGINLWRRRLLRRELQYGPAATKRAQKAVIDSIVDDRSTSVTGPVWRRWKIFAYGPCMDGAHLIDPVSLVVQAIGDAMGHGPQPINRFHHELDRDRLILLSVSGCDLKAPHSETTGNPLAASIPCKKSIEEIPIGGIDSINRFSPKIAENNSSDTANLQRGHTAPASR